MTKSPITVLSFTVLMNALFLLPASACCAGYQRQPYQLLSFDNDFAEVLKLTAGSPVLLVLMLAPAALVSVFVFWKKLNWESYWQAIALSVISSGLVAAFLHYTGLTYFNAICQFVHSYAGQTSLRDQINYGFAIGLFGLSLFSQLSIYRLTGSRVRPAFFAYTVSANILAAAFAGDFPVSVYLLLKSLGLIFSTGNG